MANKIGLKDGRPSVTILWALTKPYIIPGLELEGLKSLYCSRKISFFVAKIFNNICYSIFRIKKGNKAIKDTTIRDVKHSLEQEEEYRKPGKQVNFELQLYRILK